MVIKDYRAKLDASNPVERKIFSTPAYILNYKMRLVVCPNGNTVRKSSHMSVFLSIMRGEWDPVIKWPFDKDVKICLINQEKVEDSICDTLKPYDYLAAARFAFERPDNEANRAYGFLEFISHQIIDEGGFAKDDFLFLRCEIEI